MKQIFGHFIDELPEQDEYLTIGFSPSSVPLKKRWQNNGLSADFIAEYFKTFFVSKRESEDEQEDSLEVENLKDAVKYIANELLENAMKFQDDSLPFTAKIGFSLYEDRLIFCVTNTINSQQIESFQAFIKQVLKEEPDDLYIQSMKINARKGVNAPSRLGLLSMICDYSAKLGWKFEVLQAELPITVVSTMVYLDL
ncbi:ATP-binding protein [Candidatus Parabeggiatoa sp. HSG14]|uniref:slr1658 superfamily regulator n=1 Tax=Candidatus Parabeggiatoa sp. HSG14 TaxID=3055593 RepID=UPI0025A831BB|nr:ATP-binding protein [Thiotrichales bacterium HSG14]